MIDGFKLQFTGDEIVSRLEARSTAHRKRAGRIEEIIVAVGSDKISEGLRAEIDELLDRGWVYSDSHDRLISRLRREMESIKCAADRVAVMAAHVVKGETYRIDLKDAREILSVIDNDV